ncbi:MAG: ABC transporter substrate-binding protein [Chlamydiae bacterium CG10_big_fil_rev_8_21_14_0_10_42_34]|nr:MAG: ABC transporter substrate-binding protein [Chlamydiae bacterium CG10_big_fil_rev_8_21_14_0_10_42_34]
MRLKKVIFTLLAPLLILGCSTSKGGWFQDNGKLKVLSTTAQVGDLVKAVGGDRVDGWVLIKGDLDPHSYEIVKGDGERLDRADLIFYSGLGLEHGASLSSILKNSSKSTAIGDRIESAYPEQILKKGGVFDPHIWMDISLWQKGVDPIVEALSAMDPEGAEGYRERGAILSREMLDAHNQILEMMQKIPSEKRYLVTSHDAFHYFTRSYLADPGEISWQERFAAPEGLAPEGQLNPRDIQKIIDYLKMKNIWVLFPESSVSKDSIRKIATAGNELGLNIQICSEPLYGDAMSGLTYLEMMHSNAKTISKYLWNMQ